MKEITEISEIFYNQGVSLGCYLYEYLYEKMPCEEIVSIHTPPSKLRDESLVKFTKFNFKF